MNTSSAQLPVLAKEQTVKKLIGFTAIFLPLALILLLLFSGSCSEIVQESISHCYYTIVGNVFVGGLTAIGSLLIIYKGYKESSDDFWTTLAGVAAIGLAWIPADPPDPKALCTVVNLTVVDLSWLHYVSSAILFVALVFISLFIFRKKGKSPTPQKIRRNRLYLITGLFMLASVIAIPLLHLLASDDFVFRSKLVYYLEWFALINFGIAWLTKGEFLSFLNDK